MIGACKLLFTIVIIVSRVSDTVGQEDTVVISAETFHELLSTVQILKADYHKLQDEVSELRKTQTAAGTDDDRNLSRGIRQQSQRLVYAFSTYIDTSTTNMAVGQVLVFNKVLLNQGLGYDVASGVFTVPASGTYVFSFVVTAFATTDAKDEVIARLVLDGTHLVDAIAEVNTRDMNDQGGNQVVLNVMEGQKVWVAIHDRTGSVINSPDFRFTSFSGFML